MYAGERATQLRRKAAEHRHKQPGPRAPIEVSEAQLRDEQQHCGKRGDDRADEDNQRQPLALRLPLLLAGTITGVALGDP